MDPLIISLIFQGLRIAGQFATQGARAKAALSELEAFFLLLHEEDRLPTPDEMRQYTSVTAELDTSFARKLEALKALIEQGGGPVIPEPEPTPIPEPVPEPIPEPVPEPGPRAEVVATQPILDTGDGETQPE